MVNRMKRAFLVFVAVALLALAGCSSQQKIDAAVAEQTANLSAQVADLQANLSALQTERDEAVTQFQALNESLNQTISARDAIINDDTAKLQSCWDDRTALQAQNANLSKKVDVLQGWVDVCQKTLGNLG